MAQLRHDLRTPVNHIIGYSEMLLEDAEESGHDSSAGDLKKIRGAAQALLGLINTRLSSSGVADIPETSTPMMPSEDQPQRTQKHFRGRVLAVDDNRENLDVLARRLTRH